MPIEIHIHKKTGYADIVWMWKTSASEFLAKMASPKAILRVISVCLNRKNWVNLF